MTREEAIKAAEVMLAYADGKDIENKLKGDNLWWLIPGVNKERTLSFDFDIFDYRIKKDQEPVYRPFKDARECWNESQKHQPFEHIINKSNRVCRRIVEWRQTGDGNVFIRLDNDDMYSSKDAFELFTFADGTPFGIKEK